MDPVSAIVIALAYGLSQVGGELLEAGVTALLVPAKEQIKAGLQKKYRQAEKDQKLQQSVKEALRAAGAPLEDEKRLADWYKNTALIRLSSEKNHALRRQVARAVIVYTDPKSAPPPEIVTALGWPKRDLEELGNFLATLRSELARIPEYQELLAYADRAAARKLLSQMVNRISWFQDAFVLTDEGLAVRAVIQQRMQLEPDQAAEIERAYRAGIEDEYRQHIIQGLAQVQKAVRLPLEEIYLELALYPLKSEQEREHELVQVLARTEEERGYVENRQHEKRITDALTNNRRLVIVGKPGSGKTISLKFIALMLAKGSAGASRLGLETPLLPVLVRLADFGAALETQRDLSLEGYLLQRMASYEAGAPRLGEMLRHNLNHGGCMILLDGLDEVGDIGQTVRRGRTIRQNVLLEVQRFAERRCQDQHANRIVVTSRLEGYRQGDLSAFAEAELGELQVPEEVDDFLLRWFTACNLAFDENLSRVMAEEKARRSGVQPLMAAIQEWESIQRLASNPLLLTILAIIHELGKRLPHRRVELYEVVVKTMVESWRLFNVRQESRIYHDLRPNDVYYILASLAYWLHQNQAGGTMPVEDWKREISRARELSSIEDEQNREALVDAFIQHACAETGLLTERSPGKIGFFHLTLEEYLAAVELARSEGDTRLKMLEQNWRNPYWQEVILLAAGELELRGSRDAMNAFLFHLLTRDVQGPEQAGRPAVLVGRALLDIGPKRVTRQLVKDTMQALRAAMQDADSEIWIPNEPAKVALAVRSQAAFTLDELGWLPQDLHAFVHFPADGKTGAFWMARYPLTNAQYRRFVEAPDFADEALWRGFPKFDHQSRRMEADWGDEGWKWLRERQKDREDSPDGKCVLPRYWHDPRFGIARPGAPVVGVCWYEANAYCRWLARHWAELDEGLIQPEIRPQAARLPTEIEWARAAGGEGPEGRYPWDKDQDVTRDTAEITRRANVSESGIGRTTPVGMYPLGATPQGVWDLAGNVWEWQTNYSSDSHKYPALRGGSWIDDRGFARVADRINHDLPHYRFNRFGFRVVALPG